MWDYIIPTIESISFKIREDRGKPMMIKGTATFKNDRWIVEGRLTMDASGLFVGSIHHNYNR